MVGSKMKPSNIHFKSAPGDSDTVHSLREVTISMLEYTDTRECSSESPGTSTCIFHVFKISFIVCFIMHVLVKAIHISLINKCKYIREV